ncbi:MAG: hypothetical protein SNH55_07255 [Rikenellaceae bacterium]
MERGKMTIQYRAKSNDVVVDIQLVDNTVWLTKSEIAEMFNVYLPTVTNTLRQLKKQDEQLYDSNIVQIHVPNSDCIQTLYNLDIIVELAFRIRRGYCRLIRKWFCQQLTRKLSHSDNYVTIIPIKADCKVVN